MRSSTPARTHTRRMRCAAASAARRSTLPQGSPSPRSPSSGGERVRQRIQFPASYTSSSSLQPMGEGSHWSPSGGYHRCTPEALNSASEGSWRAQDGRSRLNLPLGLLRPSPLCSAVVPFRKARSLQRCLASGDDVRRARLWPLSNRHSGFSC